MSRPLGDSIKTADAPVPSMELANEFALRYSPARVVTVSVPGSAPARSSMHTLTASTVIER